MTRRLGWYGSFDTSSPLEQGVIIKDLPIIDPVSVDEKVLNGLQNADLVTNDVIILTQSCDLVNSKVNHIHVCPIVPLTDIMEEQFKPAITVKADDKKKLFDEIQKGQWLQFHITDIYNLRSLPHLKDDYYVVLLSQTRIVSSKYIKDFAKTTKRRPILKPPYREALAQSYARYFMRVGNPLNITKFKPADYLASKISR